MPWVLHFSYVINNCIHVGNTHKKKLSRKVRYWLIYTIVYIIYLKSTTVLVSGSGKRVLAKRYFLTLSHATLSLNYSNAMDENNNHETSRECYEKKVKKKKIKIMWHSPSCITYLHAVTCPCKLLIFSPPSLFLIRHRLGRMTVQRKMHENYPQSDHVFSSCSPAKDSPRECIRIYWDA